MRRLLVLTVLFAFGARADDNSDVTPREAKKIADSLHAGDIVLSYCEPCGGVDIRVLRVLSATVVPGSFAADEGRASVFIEREVLFASEGSGAGGDAPKDGHVVLRPGTCGATAAQWKTGGMADTERYRGEYLGFTYGWRFDVTTGQMQSFDAFIGVKDPRNQQKPKLSKEQLQLIRDCAALAQRGGLPTKPPADPPPPPPLSPPKPAAPPTPKPAPTTTEPR